MGHLEDKALNLATEHSVGEWAVIIADLKKNAASIEYLKSSFPDNTLGLKVDIIVRLIGDLADNAEVKRQEASQAVTDFYKKNEEEIENAIAEQIIEQERTNMFRKGMEPTRMVDGKFVFGDDLFKELHGDESETDNSIFG